jgi:hypothetical protein
MDYTQSIGFGQEGYSKRKGGWRASIRRVGQLAERRAGKTTFVVENIRRGREETAFCRVRYPVFPPVWFAVSSSITNLLSRPKEVCPYHTTESRGLQENLSPNL